jgi:hypothetical protein
MSAAAGCLFAGISGEFQGNEGAELQGEKCVLVKMQKNRRYICAAAWAAVPFAAGRNESPPFDSDKIRLQFVGRSNDDQRRLGRD